MTNLEYKKRLKELMVSIAEDYEFNGLSRRELIDKYGEDYFNLNEEAETSKNHILTLKEVSSSIARHCSDSFKEKDRERFEKEVKKMVAEGKSCKEIANELVCSETVVYKVCKDFKKSKTAPVEEKVGITPYDINSVKHRLKNGDTIRLNIRHEGTNLKGKEIIYYRVENVRVDMVCRNFILTNFGCLKYSDVICGMRGVK